MSHTNQKNGADVLDEDTVPFDTLPEWAREQLGVAAATIFPNESDPEAEALVDHIRYLQSQLELLSSRLAHDRPEEDKVEISYRSFPVGRLPEPLSEYARASAEAIPCAPAMIAVPMLSVLSGAVGSAAKLRLKRTWRETPILWTAVVAPSGSVKSPAADYALRPVYKREKIAAERYEQEMAEYKDAVENDRDPSEKPTRDRYRMGDVTREAVAQVLKENPRGVLLARDELATWLGSFDRYANGSADLHAWLAFYESRQETVDRVSGENVTLADPAVPVTGTIQPGTLKSKLSDLHFETGFAPRLMLCMPPVESREWTEADVTRNVERRYEDVLDRLYSIPRGTEVEFTANGKEAWIEWYNTANEIVHRTPEGAVRAVASKTIGHAARIILLLHLAESARDISGENPWWSQEISADTVQRGTKVAQWLRNETLRVYDELDLVRNAVPPIMRFLHALPSKFRTSDARQVADQKDIPERTMYDWLKRLQQMGELDRPKRGLYHKS
jgi:hypothetical protein